MRTQHVIIPAFTSLIGNTWNGVQHQLIYVDANNRSVVDDTGRTALELSLERALADLIAVGTVKIVYFHLNGRGS